MAVIKLKPVVKEAWINEDEPIQLTTEEKRDFLTKISEYNKYGKAIYNENDLVQIAKELSEMAQTAEMLAMNESEDSFDKITVGRNMKDLKNLTSQFGKVATEAQSLKQRLTGLYEDMGVILNRYFDIKELNEYDDTDDGSGGRITYKTKEKNVPDIIKKKEKAETSISTGKTIDGVTPQKGRQILKKISDVEKL